MICPYANHPLNIPDDFAGTQVICPQCQRPIVLDRSAGQIQEGVPTVDRPQEANDLEERIYDGLPPLSVMLALRRKGRSYDADDLPAKYEMTPDDWKALEAFESLLHAVFALRTSIVVGGIALAAGLPFLATLTESAVGRDTVERSALVGAIVLLACLTVFFLASLALQQASGNGIVDWLAGAAGCAVLIYIGGVAFAGYHLAADRHEGSPAFFAMVSIAFNLIAIFDLARMLLKVFRALKQLEPPEISSRLVEALKYLS